MAAVAPVVEYFRLVDDGTTTDTFTFETGTAATLLDFGTVDAGSNTLKSNVSEITASEAGCQVYAIYNNRFGSSGYESAGTSDMQNATLSVVNNETGQQGNSNGVVYENKWINVVLNDHDENTENVALGRSAQDVTDGIAEGKLHKNSTELGQSIVSEIDIIINSVRSMKQAFRSTVEKITETAQSVAASSEQLTASSQQTAQSINMVAESTVSMAEGAEKQLNFVKETLDQVNHMRDNLKNLIDSSEITLHFSLFKTCIKI